jgi:rubrerythrin
MGLTTFGAIMGFAAEVVRQAEDVYRVMVAKSDDPALREVLQLFQREGRKNHSLMEKTRRENVTEMILEPVTGLHQEDYEIDLKISDQTDDVGLLKAAIILEEREKKFFRDASSKVPLPEVARIFRKIAQRKEENLSKLQVLA